jgi:hypothetical protein
VVLQLTIREPAPYWPETGKAHTTLRGAGDVLLIALRAFNTSDGEIAGIASYALRISTSMTAATTDMSCIAL